MPLNQAPGPEDQRPQPRSTTGHVLLPAFDTNQDRVLTLATTQNLVSWTLGRGTVIWRIWPAVLLHTMFAAAVVSISLETRVHLGIPNVMLTLLGVVIGFVISYRASSGYDRYWQGRTAWGDLARTTRMFVRLIWIHVPLKLAPVQPDANGKTPEVDVSIAKRIMTEKRTALDLVEGYVVSIKHHLRGEMGIYYEDLYPLVKPLHEHAHHRKAKPETFVQTVASPRNLRPEIPPFALPAPLSETVDPAPTQASASSSRTSTLRDRDPVIPPINAYGTFIPPPLHASRSVSSLSEVSTDEAGGERRPLLPGAVPQNQRKRGLFDNVSADLVPFGTLFRRVGHLLGFRGHTRGTDVEAPANVSDEEGGIQRRWRGDDVNGNPGAAIGHGMKPQESGMDVTVMSSRLGWIHTKHRPRIAGGGENLPVEILRALSIWVSVLDERGVVPGPALGGLYGCLGSFEDSLATLERILTTPLPFVYSVHIRHTVWVYLFFLPFQLVDLFGWYAIPGVGIAAFIYLGLIAAGEEIEQPFGYDENDIDLDFFIRAVIHADIERIKRVSCPNVYLGAHHDGTHIRAGHEFALDPETPVDSVFGGGRHI